MLYTALAAVNYNKIYRWRCTLLVQIITQTYNPRSAVHNTMQQLHFVRNCTVRLYSAAKLTWSWMLITVDMIYSQSLIRAVRKMRIIKMYFIITIPHNSLKRYLINFIAYSQKLKAVSTIQKTNAYSQNPCSWLLNSNIRLKWIVYEVLLNFNLNLFCLSIKLYLNTVCFVSEFHGI